MLKEIMQKKITRKKFLLSVVAGMIAIPLFAQNIFAKTFLRQTNTTMLDVDNLNTGTIVFDIGDGVDTIVVGTKGYVVLPYACIIKGFRITEVSGTPIAGSIVIDVWKDTTANYPPTVADTIAGTEKPTLTSAKTNSDTSLTTWTTSCAKGDCIGYYVDSVTDCCHVQLIIEVQKI